MSYEKRLCLLKQLKRGFSADGGPLSGAVYAEKLGSELIITPKIAGLSPLKEGRYALVAEVAGTRFCLELKGNTPLRMEAAGSLAGGFAVLLCYVRAEAEAIAFGHCGSATSDYSALLAAFSERSEPQKDVPRETAVSEEKEPAKPPVPEKYDDEAIASSDYYAPDAPPPEGESGEKDGGAVHPFRVARGLTYYNEIAPRLKIAFEKYPKDERLLSAIPHSEWVKTETALLGVVYEEGLPRYLCVALEKEPPAEAKKAAVFVPLSPFSEEEGLYVVFQDADTGDYVNVERS